MTDKTTAHNSIATALAFAQMHMTKAIKSADNPHLKRKYADLSSVMDACIPALNQNGIAVIQPTGEDEMGRYVETILIHGGSGESLKCRVPLILQKNDMQGYGSAVTYARRYGLMSMAGVAPEDDDGIAAVQAAPKARQTEAPREQQRSAPPAPSKHEEAAEAMIASIRRHGVGPVTGDPRFQADLADLRRVSPECASRVDAEIATKTAEAEAS